MLYSDLVNDSLKVNMLLHYEKIAAFLVNIIKNILSPFWFLYPYFLLYPKI